MTDYTDLVKRLEARARREEGTGLAKLLTEAAEAIRERGEVDWTHCVKWVTAFLQNSYTDFEATDEEIELMRKACAAGLDAWETAAAIAHGDDPFEWCAALEEQKEKQPS